MMIGCLAADVSLAHGRRSSRTNPSGPTIQIRAGGADVSPYATDDGPPDIVRLREVVMLHVKDDVGEKAFRQLIDDLGFPCLISNPSLGSNLLKETDSGYLLVFKLAPIPPKVTLSTGLELSIAQVDATILNWFKDGDRWRRRQRRPLFGNKPPPLRRSWIWLAEDVAAGRAGSKLGPP
jgi:hypothetical protein